MRGLVMAGAASVLLAAWTAPAFGATQLVDGGFETQAAGLTNGFCYFDACPLGAWSGLVGGGLQGELNTAWPGELTPDGEVYGFVQASGFIEQTFVANDTGSFSLSWLDAGRPAPFLGEQTYNVTLSSLAGSVILGGFSTTDDSGFTPRSTGPFQLASGTSYTLRFQGVAVVDDTAFIDQVALNTLSVTPNPVPEPAAWALMIGGFGLAGASLRARRRRLAPV